MNLQAEIKKLIDSGENPQRAVAIAYSMQLKKAQLGTTVGQDPNYNYYANNSPYFAIDRTDFNRPDQTAYNNFQEQPQQGVQLDLSDNESTATNMDIYKNPEQLQRMQRNKVYNTATNNYDENGNAINTDDYSNKDYYSKLNIYNPYGGIGLDQSLFYAGQGFGNKKPGQAALGTGLSLLKVNRGFLSGYSSGKASKESAESAYAQQFKPNTNPVYLSQEGGTISNAEEMTGAYLTETEEAPTVELEKDEFTLNSQTGEIQKVVGEKHTNGGVKSDLPAGSQVLSNYTKIGAKTAKELKEMFDISVKPKDTFAKVMDKIDAKIGYKETIEEETEYLKTLEKQQTLDTNDTTKKLNEQHLAKELKENEDKKAELEDKRIEAFQSLFEIQESRPKKGDGTEVLKKEGGNVYDSNVLNLAKQYNLSPDRVIELMQEGGQTQEQQPEQMEQVTQMIAQALQQGTPPEQVAQQLISMGIPSDQVMQLIQAVAQQMQGQSPQEEVPMAQEGGGIKAINEYLSQWEDKPTYKYGDVQATANRFRPFFDKYGIEYTADDLNSLEKIDKLSGQLQTKLIEKHPELAEDYGEKIEPTRQGLQWLVDNKAINPSDYGLKLQNGKVPVGSYGNLSDVQQKKLQIDVQALEGQKKKEFAKTNYNDNQAFFRTLDAKDIEFTNKAEYDQYIKDNEKNKVGDFYRTDKTGAYIKPILKETPEVLPANVEATPTETTQPVRGKDLGAKTVMANLPQDLLLPPSSLANLYKGEVRFGELDPIKMSAEAQNVEAERQRQTAAKELYFLNPQQRAALMASGLGQTQMATNQAIGQAEMFNAQQKQQVDQFNLQNNMKEDLTNIELNKDFERRNLAGQGIYEANTRGYYNNLNAIQRQNFADVRDLNLANAAFDKYQTDGSNIMFMPSDTVLNSQGTMKGITKEQYDKMTDAQKQAFLANAVYAPKKNG